MKRIVVNKKHLTREDIDKLKFKQVVIAVPEAGQQKLKTFRHPSSGHHIHDHGDSWVIHHDSKPSTTMLWERDRLRREGKLHEYKPPQWVPSRKKVKRKKNRKFETESSPSRLNVIKTTIQGMPHLIGEGVPGMAAYLKGRIVRSKGMKERALAGLNPKTLKRMSKWAPSHTYRDAHSAVTGAVRPAHTQASAAMSGSHKEAAAKATEEQRRRRHEYYVKNRQRLLQQKRAYRAQNRAEISRKKKIYNRKVKTGVHRQRRRIRTGSFGATYQGYK
jgi:hypothetical protein